VTSTLLPEQLGFTLGARVSPFKLPKNEYMPITATIFGKVATTDGTHPSALREAELDVDKDVKLNVSGLPVCRPMIEERTSVTSSCGPALLGKGKADFEIAFPELKPIVVTSPITVFNAGERNGKARLAIFAQINVPAPAVVVTTVTIQRKGTGLRTVSQIPVIAGGSGSLLDFRFDIGRTYTYRGRQVGYLEAKCPDGVFEVNAKNFLFKNEAKVPNVAPSTVLNGSIAIPCTPKG
jgi:hypothetical protein